MSPSSPCSKPGAQGTKICGVEKNLVKNRMIGDMKRNLPKMDLPFGKKVIFQPGLEEHGNMDDSTDCHKITKANTTVHLDSGIDVSMPVMNRALEFKKGLSPLLPCCLKLMLGSHVSGGFWLSMPKSFSDQHLPKHDNTLVLVDEDEHEHYTKYLANKNGISGGWRHFSLAHKLLAGDVLIFQLIEPRKLKVYIVRASGSTKIDESSNLVDMDVTEKLSNTEDRPEDKSHVNECCDDDLHDPEPEGIRFSDILDSEIPANLRKKYYNLCCIQNKILHKNLIAGLNSKLIAGVICEVVNIADAIGFVNLDTSVHHLESWDRTLDAFEDLGMAVGFMRSVIQKLVSLAKESSAVVEQRRKERIEAVLEMTSLQRKLVRVKVLVESLDAEIHEFELKYEEHVSGLGLTGKKCSG